MTNLTQFRSDDGIDILINKQTGEAFCSVRGYARMAGLHPFTVTRRLQKLQSQGVAFGTPKTAEIQTGSGLQGVTLINEDTFIDWIIEDNPAIAKKILKAGARVFLHSLAGYKISSTALESYIPYYERRMRAFYERTRRIPNGWFCIFLEMKDLVRDLSKCGYDLPDDGIIDISVGKRFCQYMRKDLGIEPDDVCRKYPHWYPGKDKPVDANIYPDELLPKFRWWLQEQYEAHHFEEYLKTKKDDKAIASFHKLLGLPFV